MKVGDVVDNFKLKDQFNNEFDLYENLQTSVLLVFYPKDNSMVCTRQLVNYSVNKEELEKFGVKIIGINIGAIDSHNSFCSNNSISFPVLSDPAKTVSKQFDALNIVGQNKRKLVLIGKDKKIKFIKSTFPVFFLDTNQILNELRKEQLL
jgi:peroxiredoxin Q/BCP